MRQKQNLGKIGESLAKKHLISKGYRFITSNFKTKFGEIDLIFTHQKTLVFVEVKTKKSTQFGSPEKAITPRKLKHLKKAAQIYRQQNPHLPSPLRLDAISIQLHPNLTIKTLTHFTNIST